MAHQNLDRWLLKVLLFVVVIDILLLTSCGTDNPTDEPTTYAPQAVPEAGYMAGCPQPGKWAVSTWSGSTTEILTALTTCGAGTVDVAYYLDPTTNGWKAYFRNRSDISTLHEVFYMQGLITYGALTPTLTHTSTPTPTPAPSSDQPPLMLLDDLTVVDATFIAEVLEGAIPEYGSGVERRTLDGRYYLPSQRDAQRIIEWSQVNTMPYQQDWYDCDDYAEALRHDFRLHGINSCGLVADWSGGHSYNVLIFADGQYWFIEPAQDSIVEIGEGTYKLERGWIRL